MRTTEIEKDGGDEVEKEDLKPTEKENEQEDAAAEDTAEKEGGAPSEETDEVKKEE